MDRENYEVYQLQLPKVSCWILQTAADVAEAFQLVREDTEHIYHLDHRGRTREPFFPRIPKSQLLLDEVRARTFWEETQSEYGNSWSTITQEAFSLNHAILTSTNGHALITGLIAPANWPGFLLRPIIHPLP